MMSPPTLPPIACQQLEGISDVSVYWTGPDLERGPLPALFYFALTAEESLSLDPFNQPVAFLSDAPCRVFSITLPAHEMGGDRLTAVTLWAHEIALGNNIVHDFTQKAIAIINRLVADNVIDASRIATAGLSRGAFIATHLAAAHPNVETVLGFAPMTQFVDREDCAEVTFSPLADSLSLHHLVDKLTTKNIRFYVGNRDELVDTSKCFHFIQKLVDCAFQKRIRHCQAELIIGPSIGYKGHGTAPHVFCQGAQWIKEKFTEQPSNK